MPGRRSPVQLAGGSLATVRRVGLRTLGRALLRRVGGETRYWILLADCPVGEAQIAFAGRLATVAEVVAFAARQEHAGGAGKGRAALVLASVPAAAQRASERVIAVDDAGAIVGLVCLRYGPSPTTAHARGEVGAGEGVAEVLYVDPRARGAGVGSALLTAARRTAAADGRLTLYVSVEEANHASRRACERAGFRVVALRHDRWRLGRLTRSYDDLTSAARDQGVALMP